MLDTLPRMLILDLSPAHQVHLVRPVREDFNHLVVTVGLLFKERMPERVDSIMPFAGVLIE